MMASGSSKRAEADMESLLECPVCFNLFQSPKSLTCGHSVCLSCSRQLQSRFGRISCPVCRAETVVPDEGLPTNFNLSNLVEHYQSQQSARVLSCAICSRSSLPDELWVCHKCNNILVCAVCALKSHKGHALQEANDLLENRRKAIDNWKKTRARELETLQTQENKLCGGKVKRHFCLLTRFLQFTSREITRDRDTLKERRLLLKKSYDDFTGTNTEEMKSESFSISYPEMELRERDSAIEALINDQQTQLSKEERMMELAESLVRDLAATVELDGVDGEAVVEMEEVVEQMRVRGNNTEPLWPRRFDAAAQVPRLAPTFFSPIVSPEEDGGEDAESDTNNNEDEDEEYGEDDEDRNDEEEEPEVESESGGEEVDAAQPGPSNGPPRPAIFYRSTGLIRNGRKRSLHLRLGTQKYRRQWFDNRRRNFHVVDLDSDSD